MRGVGLGTSAVADGNDVPGWGEGKKLERLAIPDPTMALVLAVEGAVAAAW